MDQALARAHVRVFKWLEGEEKDSVSHGCHPALKSKDNELAIRGTIRLEKVSSVKIKVALDLQFRDPAGRGTLTRKGSVVCRVE